MRIALSNLLQVAHGDVTHEEGVLIGLSSHEARSSPVLSAFTANFLSLYSE